MQFTDILFAIGAVILGSLAGLFVIGQRKFDAAAMLEKAKKLVLDAEKDSEACIKAAHEHVVEMKKQFETDQKEFMSQLDKLEKMLAIKSGSYQKREARIKDTRRALRTEQDLVNEMRAQNKDLEEHINQRLIQKTGFSHDRAKDELFGQYEKDFAAEASSRFKRLAEWWEESAMRDARAILSDVIYRYTAPTSVEHEYGEIIVPHDEIKGRIVGRGGQNIAFFEEFFGVDVVFNDEPNTILVGSFNLVQREIARQALKRLIREKNINEDVIKRVKPLAEGDVDKILRREGEQALEILGVKNKPPDFAKLVGRLKFRTSYGQNIMAHCFEVGYLARLLASEISADTHIAFLGGFFHDLGKAVDQEQAGSHDILSKELLEKYGFPQEIIHAAWTHHDAAPQETIEALIVKAADAVSAGRPGARAESVERYLEKIKELQETALTFSGVKKAFAINAGRELRAIVDPDKVNDAGIDALALEIAGKVQEKGGYPGKIKITTIRTTKATDYAR